MKYGPMTMLILAGLITNVLVRVAERNGLFKKLGL